MSAVSSGFLYTYVKLDPSEVAVFVLSVSHMVGVSTLGCV